MFQLAVMAGELDLRKVERLPARRFLEWEEYARQEPFNELRADYRAASIVAMVFNMAVAPKDRLPMKEFLLKYDEAAEQQGRSGNTRAQQISVIKAIAMAYGAQGARELK